MLYEFTNKERDVIQACFRAGNYYNIRDLPDEIGPNQVAQAIKERAEKAQQMSMMVQQNKKAYTTLKQADGSVFQKFEWMPDPITNSKLNIGLKQHI